MNRELLDIGSVIRQAIAMAQRTMVDGARIDLDIPRDTVHVYGDRNSLVQLISTMIDKRSPGTGVISVNAAVKQNGAMLVLTLSGPSLGRSKVEKVGPDMEKIVLDHGGSLSMNEEEGIRIALPMAVVPRNQEPKGQMQDNNATCKVLVVDDNVDGAVTLSVILKHMGHSVRITHDGNSALAVGPEFNPDLVLMDIGMPGMDGYETCERMRSEEWSANVRLVALTGWGQEEDKRKARRAGFDLHLVKPVDRKTLMDVLSATIEGRPLDTVAVQGNGGPFSRG